MEHSLEYIAGIAAAASFAFISIQVGIAEEAMRRSSDEPNALQHDSLTMAQGEVRRVWTVARRIRFAALAGIAACVISISGV